MRVTTLNLACVTAVLASLLVSPATAMTREDFMLLVMPMSDLEANQRLEREFSGLVEAKDEAGLRALGERIRSENGRALDAFTALARRLGAEQGAGNPAETALRAEDGKPPPPNSDRDIALSFGPCQYAGVMLRAIVTGVGRGEFQPVFRHGTVMIDGSDIDTMFSENMDRCEIIKNDRSPARLVGNRCLSTGSGCLDDPDNADEGGNDAK